MKESTTLGLMSEAKNLISQGYSVLPLRMPDKRPIGNWKQYQTERMTSQVFFDKINTHDGDVGIGIVCGAVSGNLEALDIDDKHYAGIGIKFLKELEETYPEVYKKLRIEKTINHGYHLPFRISDGAAGANRNLAERYATDEELKSNPKVKKKAFIEIKGEGGKITIPPTKGYSFHQEKDIPSLTRYEADLIITLSILYNEVAPEPKVSYKKTKSFRNYSTNPWDDFNSSDAAVGILEKHGWMVINNANRFTHFSRPESKTKSVSASFNKEERFYFIFTSNSNLEPNKGYSPSSLLCELKFNGDNKECYKYLVGEGFGQFTEQFETKLINRSVVNNTELPKNISPKSKELFKTLKTEFANKYPYGIFWEGDLEDGFKINKELILKVATDLGYQLYRDHLIKIEDLEVFNCNHRDFYEDLKRYIKIENEHEKIAVLDKFEDYVQKSGKYLISRLSFLDTDMILRDTRNVAYKPFLNGIVKITKSGINLIQYTDNDKYYFSNEVIEDDFDFGKKEGGLFVDFLEKAILKNENLKKYIGFLVHKYKDTSTSYFVILTEMVENPKYGGGSGKNVFTDLIGRFTTSLEVPGSQIKFTSEFFQSWRDQRLMTVSDLPKNFEFDFFKNLTSNTALIKRLYKDEVEVKSEDLPKMMFTTNYSFDISDGGLKRRTMVLEFTDFFTKCSGVDTHYGGKLFPNDWSNDDWQGYYHYMVNAIKDYLNSPKLVNNEVSESGWLKNFHLTHGKSTHEFIEENIKLWVKKKDIPVADFNKVYGDFCSDNGIQLRYKKSSIHMNNAIEAYCDKHLIHFEKSKLKHQPNTGTAVRCKVFDGGNPEIDKDDLPF